MTTLNTIIEEEKKDARNWFTSEYCVKRPAQGIRWIRSIFFDDYDQITKILESHDRAITSAMQRVAKAERMNWLRSEIEKLEGDKQPNQSVSEYYSGYNKALTSIITRYKEELLELEKGV